MKKTNLTDIRRLAGMQLNENYIYAAEEDEETSDTEEMIDEIDADHEGMAAEGEEHDGEYSDEAGMAKDQLTSAQRAASELHDLLDGDEDLPEWVQAKITKAVDYLSMANNTMKSRHEQGDVHKMSEAAKPDYIDLDKDGDRKESMKKAAHDKEAKVDEADMEEGNEFSGALAKARAEHKDSFEVDGKTYKVESSQKVAEDIAWMQAVAGIRSR